MSLVVWGVAVAGLAGLMAWRSEWAGFELADVTPFAAPNSVAPTTSNRPDSKSPDDVGPPESTSVVEADSKETEVFTDQWEPPVDERADASSTRRSGTALRSAPGLLPPRRPLPPQHWDEPSAPDLPMDVSMSPEMPDFETGGSSKSDDAEEGSLAPEAEQGGGQVSESRGEDTSVVQVSNEVEQSSAPSASIQEKLKEVDGLLEAGRFVAAHEELSKLYWTRPDQRETFQERIERTAKSIYFSPQPHYIEPYVVQPGDQLRKIARRYNVSWQYLEKLNGIDARRIRPGQKLKVIKGPFSAVVDVSDFRLTVHHHGYVVRSYPVGIGKDGTTPIGTFKVLNKVVNPQYTAPDGSVVDADDPTNPLGERWLDLGDGYGIHGTIEPDSIGRAESRGCIRLYREDVREVYDLLTVGSEVLIRR